MTPLWSPAAREEFRRETARLLLAAMASYLTDTKIPIHVGADFIVGRAVIMANVLCSKLEGP